MGIKGVILDGAGKLKIPQDKKRIKFDVGLSWRAPNSAIWLNAEDDLFVIGIEPNLDAINSIKKRGTVETKWMGVEITDENYMLLECAIDNVPAITTRKFFSMDGDPGTSSLLKPSLKLISKQKIKSEDGVCVVPFSYILDLVPWNRFEYIDLVKTDCQGKDMDVLVSMGDYLKRVAYLNCELTTSGEYENETPVHVFLSFLSEMGFRRLGRRKGDFVNESLRDFISRNSVSNKCLNL